MSESFSHLFEEIPEEQWEQWMIERQGIDSKVNALLKQSREKASISNKLMTRVSEGIKSLETLDKIVQEAEESIAWNCHNFTKGLLTIMPDNPGELALEVREMYTPSVKKKEPRLLLSVSPSGNMRSPFSQIIDRIKDEVRTLTSEEPEMVDSIITLFRTDKQMKQFIETSYRNPEVHVATGRNNEYAIIYSIPKKGINRLSDILGIGVLPTAKSLKGVLAKIAQLHLSLGHESSKSIRLLRTISRNY